MMDRKIAGWLVLVGAGVGWAGAGWAADPAADPAAPYELPVVTVTAGKQAGELQTTPMSLAAFGPAQMQEAGINNLVDVARLTPNFNFYEAGSRRTALFFIRGLGSSGPNPPAVGVFLDDVYLERSGLADFDFVDLQRVEVLRGPQSTLYGANTEAGAINLVTAPPQSAWNGRLGVEGGNHQYGLARFHAGGPVAPDGLFLDVGGQCRRRDGITYNDLLQEDADPIRESGGRAAVTWRPAPALDIQAGAMGSRDRDGGYVFAPLADVQDNPYHVQHNMTAHHDRDLGLYHLRGTWRPGDVEVKTISAFTDWRNGERYDADFTARDVLRTDDRYDLKAFSQEVRAAATNTAHGSWLLGGYYSGGRNDDDTTTLYGPDAGLYGAPPGLSVDTCQDLDTTALALFGRGRSELWTAGHLALGLRYDYDHKDRDGTVQNSMGGQPAGPEQVAQDARNDHQWSPELVLDQQWTPGVMSYGRVARGWRAGGFNSPARQTDRTYDPEYSWNYELGLKSDWWQRRLSVNLALFYIHVDNQQLLQFDPYGSGYYFRNAGSAQSRGLELDAVARPWDGGTLAGGLGYTHAAYLDAQDEGLGASYNGNRLPFVPRVNYNAAVQQEFPLVGDWKLAGRLDCNGITDTTWDEANAVSTPGYALCNLRLGVAHPRVAVYAFVKNLFDKDYITAVYAFPQASPIAQPGDPRLYGVGVEGYF